MTLPPLLAPRTSTRGESVEPRRGRHDQDLLGGRRRRNQRQDGHQELERKLGGSTPRRGTSHRIRKQRVPKHAAQLEVAPDGHGAGCARRRSTPGGCSRGSAGPPLRKDPRAGQHGPPFFATGRREKSSARSLSVTPYDTSWETLLEGLIPRLQQRAKEEQEREAKAPPSEPEETPKPPELPFQEVFEEPRPGVGEVRRRARLKRGQRRPPLRPRGGSYGPNAPGDALRTSATRIPVQGLFFAVVRSSVERCGAICDIETHAGVLYSRHASICFFSLLGGVE
jgi:hypothetical protein